MKKIFYEFIGVVKLLSLFAMALAGAIFATYMLQKEEKKEEKND